VFPFDARWWSEARDHSTRRRDPLLTLWRGASAVVCPRCGGPLRVEVDRVRAEGWAPAVHAMPLGPACGLRAHAVIDAAGLPLPPGHPRRAALEAAVEGRTAPEQVDRLADRVLEPEDHEHT
jgi:hypothetical protein